MILVILPFPDSHSVEPVAEISGDPRIVDQHVEFFEVFLEILGKSPDTAQATHVQLANVNVLISSQTLDLLDRCSSLQKKVLLLLLVKPTTTSRNRKLNHPIRGT